MAGSFLRARSLARHYIRFTGSRERERLERQDKISAAMKAKMVCLSGAQIVEPPVGRLLWVASQPASASPVAGTGEHTDLPQTRQRHGPIK